MADTRFYESARPLSVSELETLSGASFEGLAPDGVSAGDVAPIGEMSPGALSYADWCPKDPVSGAIVLAKPEYADDLRAAG